MEWKMSRAYYVDVESKAMEGLMRRKQPDFGAHERGNTTHAALKELQHRTSEGDPGGRVDKGMVTGGGHASDSGPGTRETSHPAQPNPSSTGN